MSPVASDIVLASKRTHPSQVASPSPIDSAANRHESERAGRRRSAGAMWMRLSDAGVDSRV
jgi:hypothetical protein